ncbi:hypothetical protein SAMN05660484_00857 [Eubacterium ruminantium]|uniref:dTDP-4-amino-4,6-dideoxygalactose transaminase n=1 Tax=Eubacterium ruminantium TaxID=42322 RepID=A0A1T4LS43_9FIRM|nr:hypothetical protein [Eubacterium ruminantium]SCW40224.1 hypothetical protein SAMN05660484_00857 [Eubacterium ruminantium]SDM40089.1 hypothetical protein SAMN04490370_10343 [Eubacterium ruminantium]SJZ57348.1 hypothetical protein SAMN02745110_00895 [Eubacterium ruminantium]
MEIGSFIELQFDKGKEYYRDNNIIRLNTGRAAIWHSLRILGCDCIWIPYYQCDTVRDFLLKKGVTIKYYHIDKMFNPLDINQKSGEAVLLVNYFGVMSFDRINELALMFHNVIIDNSQSFFSKPNESCLNVYSCRKFIGVPDGAYVIGSDVNRFIEEYDKCFSSDTSLFLLQRIEYGCEGKAYKNRELNEKRLDSEDCMIMSDLTRVILDGTDYEYIIKKRIENFNYARKLFDGINCIDASMYYDETTIPMVYPFVYEDDELMLKLQKAKHFQGHWWNYICDEMNDKAFEYWLSRFMIPITIDQRYSFKDIEYIYSIVTNKEDFI